MIVSGLTRGLQQNVPGKYSELFQHLLNLHSERLRKTDIPVLTNPPQGIPFWLDQVSKEGFLDHSPERVFCYVLNALGYLRTLHYFFTISPTIFEMVSLDLT